MYTTPSIAIGPEHSAPLKVMYQRPQQVLSGQLTLKLALYATLRAVED